MSDVYSNQQVAELLGISPNTIRTWKSRKADLLQENTHWFNQDGQTLWTTLGLEVLQQLRGESTSDPDPKRLLIQPETDEFDLSARYDPIVEDISEAIANQVFTKIDNSILGKIRGKFFHKVTTTERVSILSQLGLKPANPELLLQGNPTTYLPQGDNHNGTHD